MTTYLVRPDDFSIFEVDPSNGCYRGYEETPREHRQTAYSYFTFDNLTKKYSFFQIAEWELEYYLQKNRDCYAFVSWQCRSDGHGGSKGGTMEEYLEYLERVKRYQALKAKEDGDVR